MTTTKKGLELAARLIRNNRDHSITEANAERVRETCSLICRHGATLQRLAERACNQELTAEEAERDKMCEARVRELVTELQACGILNVKGADFNGDPRGAVVKLKVSDRSGDWMGGDDYVCVP